MAFWIHQVRTRSDGTHDPSGTGWVDLDAQDDEVSRMLKKMIIQAFNEEIIEAILFVISQTPDCQKPLAEDFPQFDPERFQTTLDDLLGDGFIEHNADQTYFWLSEKGKHLLDVHHEKD